MRWVFSGDLSDEARRNIRTIGAELAKPEAVTQESLGVCRIYREAVLGLSPGFKPRERIEPGASP
jgi:hypothetical protein